jgi:Ca2+-binding RTX toxin-like protein
MRKTILVVASVALAMLVAGGVAWAATIQCPNGNIFGHWRQCWGTPKADTMHGTRLKDEMHGNRGADTMYGRAENDILYGDQGADAMYGHGGGNSLWAGSGPDKLYGGPARDFQLGNRGSDKLFGGAGDDELWGAHYINGPDYSDDYIHGGRGMDEIRASLENPNLPKDVIHRGVDRIYGERGDDTINVAGNAEVGDSAKEIVDCGPGTDEVWFDEGVDVVKDNCEIKHPL